MAKNVVQYFATEQPSGKTGEVMTPYREAPPLVPMNIGAAETAAMVKLGGEISDVGEVVAKIKAYEDNHNEEIIAQKVFYDFEVNEAKTFEEIKKQNNGVKAMSPEFIRTVQEGVNSRIEDALGSVQLSPRNALALKKVLQHIGINSTKNAISYQAAQRHEVESEIIQNDYLKSEFNIKNGADWKTEAERHMKVVTSTQPGNEQLGLLHAQMLESVGNTARKQFEITNALVDLKTRYLETQGYKSDYGSGITGAIKEVESAEFIKVYGEEKQRVILASLVQDQIRRDNAYKQFADQRVGAASIKIYHNQPLTEDDIKGLEAPEIATIERLQDYQTRQNRAEIKFEESEKRAASAERRAQRAEERILAQEKSDEIEGEILYRIVNKEPIDITTDIYARVLDGLAWGSATRLVGSISKIQKDPKYKLGADIIEKAFRLGVMDAATRGNMLIDFYARVDEEQATGKRVIEIANDMVNPKKDDFWKGILDKIWNARVWWDVVERGVRGEAVKTVPIDGKQYRDGDEIIKDGKKFRVRVK